MRDLISFLISVIVENYLKLFEPAGGKMETIRLDYRMRRGFEPQGSSMLALLAHAI